MLVLPYPADSLGNKELLLGKNLPTMTHKFCIPWLNRWTITPGDKHKHLLESFSLSDTLPFISSLIVILVTIQMPYLEKIVFKHQPDCWDNGANSGQIEARKKAWGAYERHRKKKGEKKNCQHQ